jgi:hypothetical protein
VTTAIVAPEHQDGIVKSDCPRSPLMPMFQGSQGPEGLYGEASFSPICQYMEAMDNKNTRERPKLTDEQKKREADKSLADYRAREKAVNDNMARLRAERLAREAANPPSPAQAKVAKQAKSKSKKGPESLASYLKREKDAGRGS